MPEATVLVVDNANKLLEPLSAQLAQNGFEVINLTNAFSAFDALRLNGADLIIAASDLQEINGYQLSCLVKLNVNTRFLPVLLVCSQANLSDSFWASASLADALIHSSEVKNYEQVIARVTKLIQDARNQGWKSFMAKEASIQGSAQNIQGLVENLLSEKLISGFSRSLIAMASKHKKFLDQYFAFISKLFNCQASGLVISSQDKSWGSFQVQEGVAKSSFDELVKSVSQELNISSEIALDIRGNLREEEGNLLVSPEILIVREKESPLGALIFSFNQPLIDPTIRLALHYLQIYMSPVFHSLQTNQEIEMLHKGESTRAAVDPLTGLYNLDFLVGFLQQQLLFSYRQRSPASLLIIDIDHLETVNSGFGYDVGDLVIATIGKRLLTLTRSSDLSARYGGDELVVVLPNTDVQGAKILAEKIRLEVEQMSFIKGANRRSPKVTVSIGCAGFNMQDLNPETILHEAKMALSRAKDGGRNRVALIRQLKS